METPTPDTLSALAERAREIDLVLVPVTAKTYALIRLDGAAYMHTESFTPAHRHSVATGTIVAKGYYAHLHEWLRANRETR